MSPHPFTEDPLLSRWLDARHLDPRRIAEDARCRPYVSYVVLDRLFNPTALARVRRSVGARRRGESPIDRRSPLAELLYSPVWIAWLQAALDLPPEPVRDARALVRRSPPGSPGQPPQIPAPGHRVTASVFVVPGWRADDGGLVEVWRPGARGRCELVDRIVPIDNRAVLAAPVPSAAVWSVTPNRKERRDIVSLVA